MKRKRDLEASIRERTRHLLQKSAPLCAAHHVLLPKPVIRFDLRGQAAGQFLQHANGRPVLRFNLDIARNHTEDFLATTVTHEVAHLITSACYGRTAPHGAQWRAIMAFLGIIDARRCHDYRLDPAKVKRQRRWTYSCDCRTHQISTTRHNRVRTGTTHYHCRHCGSPLRAIQQVTD